MIEDQPPAPVAKPEVDRFENAWSKVCEFFPEAILIVKDSNSKAIRWRATDGIWARGAADMFLWHDRETDRIKMERSVEDD